MDLGASNSSRDYGAVVVHLVVQSNTLLLSFMREKQTVVKAYPGMLPIKNDVSHFLRGLFIPCAH